MAKFVKEFQSEYQMQENKDKDPKKVYELFLDQFPNFLDDLDLKEKNDPFLIHKAAIAKQNLIREYLIRLFEVSMD